LLVYAGLVGVVRGDAVNAAQDFLFFSGMIVITLMIVAAVEGYRRRRRGRV
jgi:hypothetical protein